MARKRSSAKQTKGANPGGRRKPRPARPASAAAMLTAGIDDHAALLPAVRALGPQLQQLADAIARCWKNGGKVLTAGNGGSAADAMHLAEELVVRFMKNRRGLPAVSLCDPTVLTCCGNDFGFDQVFARQVQAIGRRGDVLVVFTTSGNSPNILAALHAAREAGLVTCALLGKDGGKARGLSQIELLVPHRLPHRVQEAHQILYHTLCEWVDATHG